MWPDMKRRAGAIRVFLCLSELRDPEEGNGFRQGHGAEAGPWETVKLAKVIQGAEMRSR